MNLNQQITSSVTFLFQQDCTLTNDNGMSSSNKSQRLCRKGLELDVDASGNGPSQRALVEERKRTELTKDMAIQNGKRHEKVIYDIFYRARTKKKWILFNKTNLFCGYHCLNHIPCICTFISWIMCEHKLASSLLSLSLTAVGFRISSGFRNKSNFAVR